MPDNLTLNATWNLDPLPASDQPSVAYLLVDIHPEGIAATGNGSAPPNPRPLASAPLNLSLVLDTSGSMAGAKLQNLKQAVRWVIDHLDPQDSIAVTLFDDEVRPLFPSTGVSEAKALLSQVDEIREAGGTAMSKGLLVGLDEAMKGRSPGAISRIIVLTDGQTWGDADRCRELAAQAGAAGIPITALGVGAEEDWSVDLLDDMAAESGGLSGYIAKPEEISSAFQGTILAMQQAVARNLRLTLNPSTGVTVRAVYRVAPVISKLWPAQGFAQEGEAAQPQSTGSDLTLPLGDIEAQSGQTILYEMLLPARKPGQYRLARLLLKYQPTEGPTEGEAVLDLIATFAPGVQRGPGNPRVMNSVEKATTFKLQTRALQASMVGDVTNATRNLRAAATRLLNMGETELAEASEREAQKLESGARVSPAGTMKLAFDTRKLSTSETENTRAETVRFDDEAE
jgi:Ca-activated chloride channel family protein